MFAPDAHATVDQVLSVPAGGERSKGVTPLHASPVHRNVAF